MKIIFVVIGMVISFNAFACDVAFSGPAAKETFVKLYPYTQGKVTAIIAEKNKLGETLIATENIFCRAYDTSIPEGEAKIGFAADYLKTIPDSSFQCGYDIASDGVLSACSDPL
jgi:hypothetical protein